MSNKLLKISSWTSNMPIAVVVRNPAKGSASNDLLIKITGLPGNDIKYVNIDVLYAINKYKDDQHITNYNDFYLSVHIDSVVTEYLRGVYYD